MAIEQLYKKTLVLNFHEGVDLDGDPIFKRYSYTNIKEEATPDEVAQAAAAMQSLYHGSATEVNTVDTNIVL